MSNYFRRWYILFLLQSLSTRLTRGLIAEYAEYAMHARACISKRRGGEHEHAHVEEQTPMRKFRGRLLNQRCTQVRAFT